MDENCPVCKELTPTHEYVIWLGRFWHDLCYDWFRDKPDAAKALADIK